MSARGSSAEVRALLRAGRIEEAARCIVSLAERADESDAWPLTVELCRAVAARVCEHKRMAEFRDDAAAAAVVAVVGHVRRHGWSDADALLECAGQAASRHAETEHRIRNRSSASGGPLAEREQEAGFDADEIGGDLARLWELALAQLDADHPIHAVHVRRRVAEGRFPDRHATDSLRAAFVLVCEKEARKEAEEANVGFFRAVKAIAERRGQGSRFFSTLLKLIIGARLC